VSDSGHTDIKFNIPDELLPGVYANQATVWHTPHEFTLDFGIVPVVPVSTGGGEALPARIVARVQVPTSVVFEIARAISENVSKYEEQYGPITGQPPDVAGAL